ncbi:MAG TPA: hypothetical protein PKY81_15860 [bacterium]|nr:hypothetical protein [bacterium]HPN32428.1 hypothetical protein [bacterium]
MRQKIEITAEPMRTENNKKKMFGVYVRIPNAEKYLYKPYSDEGYANNKAKWLANMIKVEHIELKLTTDFYDVFDRKTEKDE